MKEGAVRKPLMDSDPTRAGAQAPAELTPAVEAAVAHATLAAAGATAAVVIDRGRPVGVVTTAALQAAGDRPGAVVADVVDYEVVRVPPTADEAATLAAFTRAAWASLLRRRPFHDRPADSPAA